MSSSNPKYDVFQQVWAIGGLSNMAHDMQSSKPGALGAQLVVEIATRVNDPRLQADYGAWEVVWGPVVWQSDGSPVADQAMVVFHRPGVAFQDGTTRDTYVVGIAGTNPASGYDWILEDGIVARVVDFRAYDPLAAMPAASSPGPLKPFISYATALGMYNLAHMVAPAGVPGAGQNLTTFLAGLQGVANSTLIFAGHSLGGALSPSLALSLKLSGRTGAFRDVYVYPTAGPTPGNQAFSKLFGETFPATKHARDTKPYQVWNTMLWNTLDVVPHAWHRSDLLQIPTLFGQAPPPIPQLIQGAIALSVASKMDYERIPNHPLPGTLVPPSVHISTFEEWMKQLGTQHVAAYATALGITIPQFNVPVNPDVHVMSSDEIMAQLKAWVKAWLASHPLQG
jgi:hypothetical protein